MAHDDDILDPDAPQTPAETAKAKAFGELVEGMMTDAATPPALASEDRALLETATMIRAGSHDAFDLPADRRTAIIDAALESGAGIDSGTAPPVTDELARRRLRKVAPWAVAAVAAAAAILLWLRQAPRNEYAPIAEAPTVPQTQLSRPADALVGRIDRARAGDASSRIDRIFADRNAGYRAVRFRRLGGDQ